MDVVGHIHDAALFIHLQIGIAEVAGLRRTNLRQVGPGGDVLLQYLLQRQIDDQIAVCQHHILLPDLPQVLQHAAQCLHLSPEASGGVAALGIGEGRQQRQPAPITAQIPAAAVAQMIQHTLALAVHDDAHIVDPGVDHVGEHKVHHPVVAAEGHGAGDAVGDQVPQPRGLSVRKDDAVHGVVHAFTSP